MPSVLGTIGIVEHDPVRLLPGPVARRVPDVVRRRMSGRFQLDEWGLDRDAVALAAPLAAARWSIAVEPPVPGGPPVPLDGPVLLVFNRWVGVSEALVVAAGIGRSSQRVVRFAGAVDVAPLFWWSRRLGAVANHPDEVRGLLRAGELVAIPAGRAWRPRAAGAVCAESLRPAFEVGAAVVPVAVVPRDAGYRWTLRLGEPMPTRAKTRAGRRRALTDNGELERFAISVGHRLDSLLG